MENDVSRLSGLIVNSENSEIRLGKKIYFLEGKAYRIAEPVSLSEQSPDPPGSCESSPGDPGFLLGIIPPADAAGGFRR